MVYITRKEVGFDGFVLFISKLKRLSYNPTRGNTNSREELVYLYNEKKISAHQWYYLYRGQ